MPAFTPKGVDSWLIYQTAERAPAIGGVGNFMDYNRWNGTSELLLAYFGRGESVRPALCPVDGLACPRPHILPETSYVLPLSAEAEAV